jgi:hypothetical protein
MPWDPDIRGCEWRFGHRLCLLGNVVFVRVNACAGLKTYIFLQHGFGRFPSDKRLILCGGFVLICTCSYPVERPLLGQVAVLASSEL